MVKRILFITPNLSSGGAEKQMVTIARELKLRGNNVEFLCFLKGDFFSDILLKENIPIHWKEYKNLLSRMISVRKFVRKGKYDVVISFLDVASFLNNFSAVGGCNWKVITGVRSAQIEHLTSIRGKVFAWFQRYADYIVCNSVNAKDMWIDIYPQYKDKLKVIYNNVLLHPIEKQYLPKKNGKLNIVVAASYQYLKNPLGLIEAIKQMNNEERDLLHIDWFGRFDFNVGNRKPYEDSCFLINKYGLHDTISLNSDTREIHNKMNEADVVALFSRVEGLPNAICEGMSLSKPIIMTRVSDYKILVDKSNGYLCNWNEIDSIKQAILSMAYLDVDSLKKMGLASKNKADKLFSKTIVVNEWETLWIK